MPDSISLQVVIQNMKDAGCDSQTIQRFLELQAAGQTDQQLKLLSLHRKQLLDQVHQSEKCIDCLDYLVYLLEKSRIHKEVSE